jgi:hypothetical protein
VPRQPSSYGSSRRFLPLVAAEVANLAKPAAADGPYHEHANPRCCAGAACNGHLFLVPSLVHCPNARDSTIGWRVARSPSRRSSLIEAGGGWQQPLPTPRPTCLLAAAKAGASQKAPNASPASSNGAGETPAIALFRVFPTSGASRRMRRGFATVVSTLAISRLRPF